MHVRELHAVRFRRFTDLTIRIEGKPKLVVLSGANGSGKSSVFDAFRFWSGQRGAGWQADAEYFVKSPAHDFRDQDVQVAFHEPFPDLPGVEQAAGAVYVRTAYRNDPEFAIRELRRAGPVLRPDDEQLGRRMIDNDVRVSENYQRLVALTLEDVYNSANDDMRVGQLREKYIGQLRNALSSVFPAITLIGPGDPLDGGTFRFTKGSASNFAYKNLAAGEKAAFDLFLDLLVRREAFNDSVFCIDEPEAHLNARVQGHVLRQLASLITEASQLWIATHSIGMLREAKRQQEEDPTSVAFVDLGVSDFDEPVVLAPTRPDRDFWHRTFDVALGDLASLIAPSRLVLCEGKPVEGNVARSEFDARCFRNIFGNEYPDTEFVSVGNSREVETDYLKIGSAFSAVVSGTTVLRVIDRDFRSPQEVVDLEAAGVRVLTRRHLESYLLDHEVLRELCNAVGEPGRQAEIIRLVEEAVKASVDRGNDADDLKSAAGQAFVSIRKALQLPSPGNSMEAFLADTLAPLLRPGMVVYEALERDVFGTRLNRDT